MPTVMQASTEVIPATPEIRPVYDLTFNELERVMTGDGLSAVHARTVWKALYREPSPRPEQRRDFAPPLQRWIAVNLGEGGRRFADPPRAVDEVASTDGLTRKFLLQMADGQKIETVLMGYTGRFTACLSTQAGCAMGCVFCATGQMGLSRHLTPAEIVGQVLHARTALGVDGRGALRNLVLMGMGEPLHNYDAVMKALEIITDTRGINIGPARITISTVGVVPGILRMAAEQRPYGLAVSLHGTDDTERNALVPAGRRWPMAELMDACRTYCERTQRRIFFEWTLIAGNNDSPDHARRLSALLARLDAHVNLIPLNPTNGYDGTASPAAAADEFQRILKAAGIPSTVRQRRGIDVAAGCGQLQSARARPSR